MPPKVKAPAPATPGVITLSADDSATIASMVSERPGSKPPKYLEPVREALNTGDMKAITLTSDDVDKEATNARNNLSSAADRLTKELGIATYDGNKIIGGHRIAVRSKVVKYHKEYGSILAFTAEKVEVKQPASEATATE